MSNSDTGALPSLDAKPDDEPILGAPNTKKKSKSNVGKLFFLIAILVVLLFIVFGAMWFLKGRALKAKAEVVQKEKQQQTLTQKNTELGNAGIERTKQQLMERQKRDEADAAEQKAADEAERQRAEEEKRRQALASQPGASGGNQSRPGQNDPKGQQVEPMTPEKRRLTGAVLADFSNTQDQNGRPTSAQSAPSNPAQAQRLTSASGNTTIGAQLQGTVLEKRLASRLPNLTYLLKKGTDIPCELKTGIDSTLPGFVTCKVINDVYSANHETLLVERGADVFGEQQTGLKQGQARVFALWTRIDNPSGVTFEVDSPGTDQMGFNGIPGYVDSHFMERFGGAILISLIDDVATSMSQNKSSGGNTQLNFGGTSSAASDTSTEVIKNTINIPPNLITNPATIVHVLVARDVSFESVYKLNK